MIHLSADRWLADRWLVVHWSADHLSAGHLSVVVRTAGFGTGLVESPGLSDVGGGVTTLDGPSVDDVIVSEPELGWPDGGVAPLLSNVDVGDVLGADGPALLGGGVDG